MTRPLTGLTGLAGIQRTIDEDSQATPEERMGGTADPSHSKYLAEDYIRRGAQMGAPRGPYGPENQMLGDEVWFWESGGDPTQDPYFDRTPSNRAGPFPKGIQSGPVGDVGPDATAMKLEQSYKVHSVDTSAHLHAQTARIFTQNDQWETVEQVTTGSSDLVDLPKQAKSSGFGWGTRDRTQSMARQNEYGFDAAHQYRRFATGSIPGNTMWMRPGGRPMVKTLAGPARPPIGVDSPFTGQDLGQSFSYDGAVLQNVPQEYQAPPTPKLAPVPSAYENDSYVEWY